MTAGNTGLLVAVASDFALAALQDVSGAVIGKLLSSWAFLLSVEICCKDDRNDLGRSFVFVLCIFEVVIFIS